jgi:hypothetical protein
MLTANLIFLAAHFRVKEPMMTSTVAHRRFALFAMILLLPGTLQAADKWEYGVLRHDPSFDKGRVTWVTARGVVIGDNWEDMADKLKTPIDKELLSKTEKQDIGKKEPDPLIQMVRRVVIFTQLGQDGWELSTTEHSQFNATYWTFKRPPSANK